VLLGNGDGTFGQQLSLPNGAGSGPNWIDIGDLNKDGLLDFVIANSNDGGGNVGVFLGKRGGGFQDQMTLSTGSLSNPPGLALGDFNYDSILDLVVAVNSYNITQVFLGNGNGGFTLKTTLPNGFKPSIPAVGDFNKDGRLDFAVTSYTGNMLGIFLGDGTGGFGAQSTYPCNPGSYTLVVVDLNKDGILDIIIGNYFANSTTVLFGNGDGTFKEQRGFSTGKGSLPYLGGIRDLNYDGIPDLVVANSGTDNVSVFLGNVKGRFKDPTTFSTGTNSAPELAAIGDFNGDGRLDIVSANYGTNQIGILLNTCS
jgi:hypothetical protein